MPKKYRLFVMALVPILVALMVFSLNAKELTAAIPSVSNNACTDVGNPASFYCTDIMGYDYQVITDETGAQDAVCIMPDDTVCSQWDFYSGTCGAAYSYCALNGMNLIVRGDGNDPFNMTYGLCVDELGREIGTIWDLNGLPEISDEFDLGGENPLRNSPINTRDENQALDIPPAFNWLIYQGFNWSTPVKNQGSCGSCWAFSAIGAAEMQNNITAQNPNLNFDLSEQYLVSDCFPYGNCSGGNEYIALYQIYSTGIPDEACYPYRGTNSSCSDRCLDYRDRLVNVPRASYLHYPKYTETDIKTIISHTGPVVLTIGTAIDNIGAYWDGDIYRCKRDYPNGGTSRIDHGVVAVGYDDVGGYWIVKNSWGSSWNGNGYFKLGYNECNVAHSRISWADYSPPIMVTVSDLYIPEGNHDNRLVGTLLSEDLDMDDNHTYSLVPGEGSEDNHLFEILNDQLIVTGNIEFSNKNTLSIRVRSTDIGGQYNEEIIRFSVIQNAPVKHVFVPLFILIGD